MLQCQEIFDLLMETESDFIQRWIDIVNIESPTNYKEGVDKVGQYFIDFAKEMNWDVEVFKQKVVGNVVCITMNKESDQQPISLSGHIDTVHPLGSFGYPPARYEDKKIYGPGVMDCKGGTMAALQAMYVLDKVGYKKRPIQLLLQTDEECNSMLSNKATINYICEKAKNSVCFLNCESSFGSTAVLMRKGIVRFNFHITGNAVHASKCFIGTSAIREAARKILQLEKLKDQDGITCNCGLISGGTSENTVPDTCTFAAEFRYADRFQRDYIDIIAKEISARCHYFGCYCTYEKTGYRPAMEYKRENLQLLNKINEFLVSNDIGRLSPRDSFGGSDAAEIVEAGIPCIDSIGVEGDYIHTTREFAYDYSLFAAARRIAVIAYNI